jgi:GDPmannose 4,6-dehydratase
VNTALLLGGGGQDGYFLAKALLDKDVRVVAGLRPGGTLQRWPDLQGEVAIAEVDVTDAVAVRDVLEQVAPEETYHLAGFSSVGASWEWPRQAIYANAVGTLNVLDAVRELTARGLLDTTVVHCSSGEVFAGSSALACREGDPVMPLSPYGIGKAAAKQWVEHYREFFGVNAKSAILFSHESSLRTPLFVSRRISDQVARVSLGMASTVEVASLRPQRDWGFAGDYVEAMIRIARHPVPEDFVIASGVAHSVGDWVRTALSLVGVDDWEPTVMEAAEFGRPVDPSVLVGDASKARDLLGWTPTVSFEDLVAMLLEDALVRARAEFG